MASVSLRGVTKSFGKVAVIHGVDLEIADGEFVVIVGPSGCGKSTILRMIAGLEQVGDGEIFIGDRLVNRLEPKDRDIAMVFQNYALYPHMSVYDNMAYGLRNRGMRREEIDERVRRAAHILQLGELLQRRPRQLSGGQRQRVAMGRAIVREPAVFLFDEPLSNLDAKLRVQMRLEIKKLHNDLGVTSIYVTHDQVEAMTLADRLVVMNAGVTEQVGVPRDVYDRPVTAYVAGFIGSPSMNFLPARTSADGLVLADGTRLATLNGVGADDRPVTVGIRPEHLRLAGDAEADVWRTQVELAEQLGADTLVHGRIGDADLVVRLPGHVAARRGEWLAVLPEAGAFHLFDPATGHRLDS